MVSRLDHHSQAARYSSSTIIVLSSRETAWQAAILEQLLLKHAFRRAWEVVQPSGT